MAKKPKMTDDELLKRVQDEERTSLSYLSGELSDERAANMELFLGEKTRELTAAEGRSSVVSMDVQEAIESVMPSLMKVFCGGDEIVRFDPQGPEDVKPSEQESDYVNYVVTQQNNWFQVSNQWFKDALINKNAYVKYWWDESVDVTEESYQGLTDEELQMLLQGDEVEPIAHESSPDEQAVQQLQQQMQQAMQAAQQGDPQAVQAVQQLQSMPMPMLHNVKVKRTNTRGQVRIEPCAPEEILVSADERNIDPNSCRFFEHRCYKTISELREMGYDIDDEMSDTDDLLFTEEWRSRQEFTEEETWRDANSEGANKRLVYREAYYNIDFDGDGIAERRMICIVGKKILSNETVDLVGFAAITPYLMPHMHFGRALADYIKDIMVIKSVILRNVLDNFYASNNGRTAISGKVNLDDMLVSRPGGVVRVDGIPANEIMPLQVNAIGQAAFPLMEYLDNVKETRTGITKYNQGMDSQSLNKTASGISQIMGAAQQRLELIARTFAETGVKQLFLGVHKLLLQHSKKEQITRLKNEWVPVDPRQWKTRTDMTVAVGLGTGNKQEMLVQIMQILQVQERALPLGITTPKNIYEACMELTKNAGFKDADKYWTDPAKQQPQEPKPDPEMAKVQAKAESDKATLELKNKQAAADAMLDEKRLQQEAQLAQQRMQLEMQLAHQQMIKEMKIAQDEMIKEVQLAREKMYAEIGIEQERLGLQREGMAQKAKTDAIDGGVSART